MELKLIKIKFVFTYNSSLKFYIKPNKYLIHKQAVVDIYNLVNFFEREFELEMKGKRNSRESINLDIVVLINTTTRFAY